MTYAICNALAEKHDTNEFYDKDQQKLAMVKSAELHAFMHKKEIMLV